MNITKELALETQTILLEVVRKDMHLRASSSLGRKADGDWKVQLSFNEELGPDQREQVERAAAGVRPDVEIRDGTGTSRLQLG